MRLQPIVVKNLKMHTLGETPLTNVRYEVAFYKIVEEIH